MTRTDDGQHMWRLKHFKRPAYCNVCETLLLGLRKQGLCCTFCKFTVHERCARKAPPSCISTYAKSRREAGVSARPCAPVSVPLLTPPSVPPSVHLLCQPAGPRPRVHHPRGAAAAGEPGARAPARGRGGVTAAPHGPLAPQVSPVPDTHPLLVFVNPKSGGKQGER
uniref:Uncharacterized protein n=1 Tax=Nothoprocta perdicaria TaxID=30464 RepID=A0A8C6ZGW9_NOTPE